jgi:large subunit ribosomal protein L22
MADDIRAHANYISHSPQKVRLVIDLVRGKDITEALDMLKFVQNKAKPIIRRASHIAVVLREREN